MKREAASTTESNALPLASDSTVIRSHERESLPVAATLLARIDPTWKFVLWLLVTARVVFGIVSIFLVHLGNPRRPPGVWANLVLPGNQSWVQALSTWQRWDSLWYQHIAEQGYSIGNGTTAFYPLFPLLARVVSIPLAGNVVLAELVVSSIAFAFAMWLLYQVAVMEVGRAAGYMTVILMAAFPTGFFLLAPYSESLFLALTVASLWFARRGQPWLAGVAGFAAALTRAQGVLLILPLVFEYIRRQRERGEKPGLDVVAPLLPSVGWISFAIYVRMLPAPRSVSLSGEGFWYYTVVTPWQALSSSWQWIIRSGDIPEILNLTCLLGFALLAVGVSRRLPFVYTLYVWPLLALLFTRHMGYSPLMSVTRLVLVLFPCFILAASWLVRRPWLALGTLVVSVCLQMTLFTYFIYWWFIA